MGNIDNAGHSNGGHDFHGMNLVTDWSAVNKCSLTHSRYKHDSQWNVYTN